MAAPIPLLPPVIKAISFWVMTGIFNLHLASPRQEENGFPVQNRESRVPLEVTKSTERKDGVERMRTMFYGSLRT